MTPAAPRRWPAICCATRPDLGSTVIGTSRGRARDYVESNQSAIADLVWDVTTGAVLVETTIDVGSIAQPPPDSTVQWGIVHFDDGTQIVDRVLVGDYVLVHDHYWDSGDRPCTTTYEFESSRAVEAVVSFSCRRIAPPTKLDRFSVLVRPTYSLDECARARRSSMDELTAWTLEADKVIVF